MKHTFDYFYTMQPNDSFLVDDISNVVLNVLNDVGQEWYIKVSTELGDTEIIKFGPIFADNDNFANEFKLEYCKIQYNEKRIINEIDRFINDNKKIITQIIEIDESCFHDRLEGIINATGY